MSVKDMIRDSLIDTRPFVFGEVWTIKDELVSIPDADRINDRVCMLIDQCLLCPMTTAIRIHLF